MKLSTHLLLGILTIAFASTTRVMAQGHMHNMNHQQLESAKSVDTTPIANVEYRCPMDKDVVSSKPGKCPKCGMALKKVTVQEASAAHVGHSANGKSGCATTNTKGADSVNVQHNHDKM